MKTRIFSITILTLSVIFHYGFAYHLYIEEILKFCKNNGHKFVALSGDQKSIQTKKYFLESSHRKYLRSKIFNGLQFFQSDSDLDTLIFLKENNNTFNHILKILHQHKIQQSIIVIDQTDFHEFKGKQIYTVGVSVGPVSITRSREVKIINMKFC